MRPTSQYAPDAAIHIAADTLISTLEHKHPYTAGHAHNVERLTLLLAGHVPELTTVREFDWLCIGARLHDIGKLRIENAELDFPGPLSGDILHTFRQHPRVGASILKDAGIPVPTIVHSIILRHHEAYDGMGYPSGIAGNTIPLVARMVAVTDVFDALVSQRSYKDSMGIMQAADILSAMSGKKLDPWLVRLFTTAVIPQLS